MKTKILLNILLVFVLFLSAIGQTPQVAETFDINIPISWDASYVAKERITLQPGFSFNSQDGNTFEGTIDTGISVPAGSENGGNGDLGVGLSTGFINSGSSSAPPGSLPISVDVSSTGAAVSNLPLLFPKGFAGMVPQLSLSYNSQGGQGLFGEKWQLSGLSSITRTVSDINLDGDTYGITFTNTDQFMLDGQRLMFQSGIHGEDGAIYYKRATDFSTISCVGAAGDGPDHFVVETRSQETITYAGQLMVPGSSTVLAWYISEYRDARGNTITYNYDHSNDGQAKISSIEYTSNSNGSIGFQYTINFSYNTFSQQNRKYLGGKLLIQDQYITSISCTDGTSYSFDYNGRKLQSISLFKNNSLVCSPTSVVWDAETNTNIVFDNLNPNNSFDGIASTNDKTLQTYNIDLDGDGVKEFLRISQSKDLIELFNYVNGELEYIGSHKIPTCELSGAYGRTTKYTKTSAVALEGLYISEDQRTVIEDPFIEVQYGTAFYTPLVIYDADNDGLPELCITYPNNSNRPFDKDVEDPDNFHYQIFEFDISNTIEFIAKTDGDYSELNHAGLSINMRFLIGDFNGDGITEPIIINASKDDDFNLPSVHPNVSKVTGNKIMVANFNNNKKEDLIVVNDGTIIVYEAILKDDGTNQYQFKPIKYIQNIVSNKAMFGDFNGDGLIDFLTYAAGWSLYCSDGLNNFVWQGSSFCELLNAGGLPDTDPTALDFISHQYETYHSPGNETSNRNVYKTADFNRDGLTDIVKIERDANFLYGGVNTDFTHDVLIEYTVELYVNNGQGFNKRQIPGPRFYNVDDICLGSDCLDANNTQLCFDYCGDKDPYEKPELLNPENIFGNVHLIQDNYFLQPNFKITDLNSDGFPELFHSHNHNSAYYSLHELRLDYGTGSTEVAIQFYNDDANNKVSQIIGGNGLKQTLSYSNLLALNNYTQGEIRSVDEGTVYSIPIPLVVVKSITKSFPYESSISAIDYSYNSILLHNRSGLLGFRSITSTDDVLGVTTEKYFEIEPAGLLIDDEEDWIYLPYIATQSIYKNGNAIKEIEYANSLEKSSFENFFSFIPNTTTIVSDKLTNTTITTTNQYSEGSNRLLESTTIDYGDAGTSVTEFPNYHKIFNVPETIVKTTDTYSETINYTYDDTYGYVKTSTDKFGNITDYTYEPDNTNIQTVDVDDGFAITSFTYDNNGHILTKETTFKDKSTTYLEEFEHDSDGRLLSYTNKDGLVTTHQYDKFGNKSVSVTPNGVRTAYAYDYGGGDPKFYSYVQSTDDAGNINRKYTDRLGRKTKVEEQVAGGNLLATETTYNTDGTVSEVEHLGQITSYSYDTKGRVESIFANGQTTDYSYVGKKTTISKAGISKSKTINDRGQVVTVQDDGGTINYTYHGSGNISSIDCNGSIIEIIDDNNDGLKDRMDDPDAGTIEYFYDNYGRLTDLIEPNENTITTVFDDTKGGRIEKEETKDADGAIIRTVTYSYYDAGDQPLGTLASVYDDNSEISTSYTYDEWGRVITKNEIIDDNDYLFSYNYTSDGKISKITYPNGISLNQSFSGEYLSGIALEGGTNVFSAFAYNDRNQVVEYTQGNTNKVINTYNDYGYLTSTTYGKTANRALYNYDWDESTGLLSNRSYTYSGSTNTDDFTYDNLNRLTNWLVDNNGVSQDYSSSYQNNGNISRKSDMGFYEYSSVKHEHAVSNIWNLSGTAISSKTNEIDYNSAQQPTELRLINGTSVDTYNLFYGPDDQRRMTEMNYTKTIYSDLYEERYGRGGSLLIQLCYIKTPNGLNAVYVSNSSYTDISDGIYYLNNDHLGSLIAVEDNSGNFIKQFSYDPWGRRRNSADWNDFNVLSDDVFTRGFTGHEHLDAFGLINMNGRIYDPRLGRMLSPDNNIQLPDFSQNFNRYSYCWNNPLSYTDPDGEFVLFVLGGAVLGSYIGGALQNKNTDLTMWKWNADTFKAMGIGAIVGGAAGAGLAASLGAANTGLTGVLTTGKAVGTLGWEITSNALLTGAINVASTGMQSDWNLDATLQSGLVGLATGAATTYIAGSMDIGIQGKGMNTVGRWHAPQKLIRDVTLATTNGFGVGMVEGYHNGKTGKELWGSSIKKGIFSGALVLGMSVGNSYLNAGNQASTDAAIRAKNTGESFEEAYNALPHQTFNGKLNYGNKYARHAFRKTNLFGRGIKGLENVYRFHDKMTFIHAGILSISDY